MKTYSGIALAVVVIGAIYFGVQVQNRKECNQKAEAFYNTRMQTAKSQQEMEDANNILQEQLKNCADHGDIAA